MASPATRRCPDGHLLQWLPQAEPNDINSQLLLADIFTRHMAFGLADGALQNHGATAQDVRQKLLALYQQRLEKAWPGKGKNIGLVKGAFAFSG